MKKKYSYLFIFTLIFFSFQNNVNAIYFKNSGAKVYYNDNNLEFRSTKKDNFKHVAVIKKYTKTKNGSEQNAFCSDKDYNFYSGSSNSSGTTYVEDKDYKKATCRYRLLNKNNKWKLKGGGDCSKIVGYIIQAAYNYTTAPFEKYAYAQAAVWTYLSSYAITNDNNNSGYLRTNNKSAYGIYQKNTHIKRILRAAWTNYNQNHSNTTETLEPKAVNNLITITKTSNEFYYKAASDQCGSSGAHYITGDITITNNSTEKIKLTIESTDGTEIVESTTGTRTAGEYNLELGTGTTNKSVKFKIRSEKYIGAVTLKVKAETEEKETGTGTDEYYVYDSERWKTTEYSNAQGLIIQTAKKKKKGVTYSQALVQEVSESFNQDKIITKTPNQDSIVNEATGKCANIATTMNEISKTLTGTTCKTIKLGDNFVRIILSETVKFEYGYLFPSKFTNLTEQQPIVYSGGSFNLNADTTKGAITNYQASVTWDFADYNETDKKPYYYNATNPSSTDASSLITDINNALLEGETGIKKKYENLQLNIDTYNSNELENGVGKSETEYKLNLYNNAKNVKSTVNSKTLSVNILQIELQKYKHKDGNNGFVEYGSGEYRGYFVPMYYPNGSFKFDISKTNLSIINEIDLNYTGSCNIDVENRFTPTNLRYRSISLNNPFPKSEIPENWDTWYKETKNKTRIAKTYQNPIMYSINLNRDKFNKINQFNKASLYTDWTNIKTSDGTSKVVQEQDLFEKKANSNSYCAIGIFDASCDVYVKSTG